MFGGDRFSNLRRCLPFATSDRPLSPVCHLLPGTLPVPDPPLVDGSGARVGWTCGEEDSDNHRDLRAESLVRGTGRVHAVSDQRRSPWPPRSRSLLGYSKGPRIGGGPLVVIGHRRVTRIPASSPQLCVGGCARANEAATMRGKATVASA